MKFQGTALTLAVAFALTACGGGGGGSDTASNNTPQTPQTPPSTVLDSSVQAQPTASNYGAGTAAKDAYEFLNAQRVSCGFGSLDQSAQIDTAAQAHSDYLKNNNLAGSHYEDQTNYPAGFTGVTPDVRIKAAGYAASSGAGSEVIGYASASTFGTTLGRAAVMGLFLAPYHGMGMLQGDRDVGIGYNTVSTQLIMDFGYTNVRPKQQLASNVVASYPCNGTTGVLTKSYYDESPAPFAGRNLQTTPIGHPIFLKVRDAQTLALSAYELRKSGATMPVPVQLLSKASDTSGIFRDNSNIVIVPTVPLDPNSTYTFTASGSNTTVSNTAQAVNVSFTFTTGAY